MDANGKSIALAALGNDTLRNAAVGVVLAVGVVGVAAPGMFTGVAGFLAERGVHPHAPNLALIAAAPPAVRIHLTAALTSLIIGIALMPSSASFCQAWIDSMQAAALSWSA